MRNTIFTYKDSFLLHQEFIVEYNIIIAKYITAITTYGNFPILQFVNI